MIGIARKNLSSLFLSPNSFLCKSNVHLFPSIRFFSSSRIKTLTPSPDIYDVFVHKHQFSPELASSVAASLSPKLRSSERADSFLSFLKENSFTTAQLEKIVIYDPRILGFSVENLKSRLNVFYELGLSSEEIAKIFSSNQSILHSSLENKIIPSLSMLKGLLGSNEEVARLLKKCAWFVSADLEKILVPNMDILKSCGMRTELVLHSLYLMPRCFFFKPDLMRKSVDKAIEIGIPLTSAGFIFAAGVLTSTSEEKWEVKLQTLRDLGFSDYDVFAMFRKQPTVFAASAKKMKNKVELLLATGKYNISSIVTCPTALSCSIEKRIEPRFHIIRLLESRNLIQKWPSLPSLLKTTDDQFIDLFIRPYYDEIGEEHITERYIPRPNADDVSGTVVSFMKENSFTTAQLEKIVIYNPRILGYTVENLKSKLKVFQELDLSSKEIAQIYSSNPAILHYSVSNKIIPSLSILKGWLGSNDEVARLLKKCSWFLNVDLEKILMPNVEYLKSCGMPTERVLHSLYLMPRFFLFKPDIMRKSVNKAIEIGVPLTSSRFIHAAGVFASTTEEMWEVKLQTLRELGFSDNDMFAMFRNQPSFFAASAKKMKNKIEVVLATGKYNISSIFACPRALTCSTEKRMEPRFHIMRLLESRNLIQKWPCLSSLLKPTDDQFIKRYIRPYYDEIGEEHITQRYIPKPKGDDVSGTGTK